MEAGKLASIIQRKNEDLEQNAVNDAGRIIEQIAREQENIATAQARIKELQGELKSLEIPTLDASKILGE